MSYDIVIKNGRVIDGAGNPWFKADVGIKDGKITKLGKVNDGTKEIDVKNLIVSPGFIDPHSHSDRVIPFDPRAESTIRQGITTLVVGMCGYSMAPVNPERADLLQKRFSHSIPPGQEQKFAEFLGSWRTFAEYLKVSEQMGCASNIVPFVGFVAARIAAMGFDDRAPTSDELDYMKKLVEEAMQAGAFGFSTGLVYTPQIYAKTDEIIELAKVAGMYGGLYFSHIRGEGSTVIKAVKEVIEIVEKSGCIGGQVGHHKVAGKPYWGLSKETLQLIEEANARGLNITCDQYPYTRGMAALVTALPPWSHEGGLEKLIERLKDPNIQARIKKEVTEGIEGWENWIKDVGFDGIYIAALKTDKWKDVEGKSITEITKLRHKSDDWETLFELLIDEKGEIASTFATMGEEDVLRIMQGRHTMVGTDGWSVAPTGVLGFGKPHPRLYGTYPRMLGRYVREKGVLTLEDAIRRMTSFPAQRLGLLDRGLLREGCWADVVCFNPDIVIDKATFEDPHQFPIGIEHVIVNGKIVVENNRQLDIFPGKILRRPT